MNFIYKKPVISLSGSFFSNTNLIKAYAKVVKKIKNKLEFICIVTGGGEIARKYISLAKELGLSRKKQDEMGIAITRVNALLFGMLFNFTEIPKTYEQAVEIINKYKFCICGGMVPKQSTDKVAVDIAVMCNADIMINLTKVEGVYNKDPKKPGAKLLRSLTYKQLREILKNTSQTPGNYPLFDLKAIKIAEKNSLPIIIANGTKPENLIKILKGEKIGTFISF